MIDPFEKPRDILAEVALLLRRWEIAASAEGVLLIRPKGRRVGILEFHDFVERLKAVCTDDCRVRIIFDFVGVTALPHERSEIVRLLTKLAVDINATCSVATFDDDRKTMLGARATPPPRAPNGREIHLLAKKENRHGSSKAVHPDAGRDCGPGSRVRCSPGVLDEQSRVCGANDD